MDFELIANMMIPRRQQDHKSLSMDQVLLLMTCFHSYSFQMGESSRAACLASSFSKKVSFTMLSFLCIASSVDRIH